MGDAPYYEPLRLSPRRAALGLRLPGPVDPERFLGLELQFPAPWPARGGLVRATGQPIDLTRRRFSGASARGVEQA